MKKFPVQIDCDSSLVEGFCFTRSDFDWHTKTSEDAQDYGYQSDAFRNFLGQARAMAAFRGFHPWSKGVS